MKNTIKGGCKPTIKIVKNVHQIENVNHKEKADCGHGYVYS